MSGSVLLAAASAAAASVALSGGSGPRWDLTPRRRHGTLPALLAGAVVLVVLAGAARLAVLATILLGAAEGARRLLALRRARAEAAATSARVLETCEVLAGELAAGRAPGAALDLVADAWSVLEPVAQAHRVGADVAAAWRQAAQRPGAEGLRLVAAGWQVAHRTGAGLAGVVELVGADLHRARATRRVVDGELASARATARLVAALPLLALAMGSGAGSDPWAFLLGAPLGLACLAGGLAFGLTGLAWIEVIARGVEQGVRQGVRQGVDPGR